MSRTTPHPVRVLRPDRRGELKLIRVIDGETLSRETWKRFKDEVKRNQRPGPPLPKRNTQRTGA